MDKFLNVILAAGLGCFVLSFLLSGLYPYLIADGHEVEATIAEVAARVTPEFKDLKDRWPHRFAAAFANGDAALTDREIRNLRKRVERGELSQAEFDAAVAASEEAWPVAHADALQRGRDVYVAEACWHCHSQYVRPVANEEARWGPVLTTSHDNNALQRPVLWGTRRVGPDLTHEGGRRSNGWHAAHLWNPRETSPDSVMPSYTWYFEDGWQVMRTIDPEKARFGNLSPDTAYPYPGIYASEDEAAAALEDLKKIIESDQDIAAEAGRLFVAEGRGPNSEGLALIAYLQWLGTWDPFANEEAAR